MCSQRAVRPLYDAMKHRTWMELMGGKYTSSLHTSGHHKWVYPSGRHPVYLIGFTICTSPEYRAGSALLTTLQHCAISKFSFLSSESHFCKTYFVNVPKRISAKRDNRFAVSWKSVWSEVFKHIGARARIIFFPSGPICAEVQQIVFLSHVLRAGGPFPLEWSAISWREFLRTLIDRDAPPFNILTRSNVVALDDFELTFCVHQAFMRHHSGGATVGERAPDNTLSFSKSFARFKLPDVDEKVPMSEISVPATAPRRGHRRSATFNMEQWKRRAANESHDGIFVGKRVARRQSKDDCSLLAAKKTPDVLGAILATLPIDLSPGTPGRETPVCAILKSGGLIDAAKDRPFHLSDWNRENSLSPMVSKMLYTAMQKAMQKAPEVGRFVAQRHAFELTKSGGHMWHARNIVAFLCIWNAMQRRSFCQPTFELVKRLILSRQRATQMNLLPCPSRSGMNKLAKMVRWSPLYSRDLCVRYVGDRSERTLDQKSETGVYAQVCVDAVLGLYHYRRCILYSSAALKRLGAMFSDKFLPCPLCSPQDDRAKRNGRARELMISSNLKFSKVFFGDTPEFGANVPDARQSWSRRRSKSVGTLKQLHAPVDDASKISAKREKRASRRRNSIAVQSIMVPSLHELKTGSGSVKSIEVMKKTLLSPRAKRTSSLSVIRQAFSLAKFGAKKLG